MQGFPSLVSTDWLAGRLAQPGVRVVDGSWYMPGSGRDPVSEFVAGHIPGAVFFDLEASSDPDSPLPHMLPAAAALAERMSTLGLNDTDAIVVYDGSGKNFSAPRVWWMFRAFGHEQVAVLDGGLGKWQREGRSIERGFAPAARGSFSARLDPAAVRDLAAMRANLDRRAEQVVDMRSAARFAAAAPEPRPGLRSGHIPGSRNVPFETLVYADGTALSETELRRHLEAAGVDLSGPVVATCGSGVTACALALNLHRLGHDRVAVYDGSWTEWGGRVDTPIEVGAPGRIGAEAASPPSE
jgi:thiosulfate/3-mercaptopyruvate sulfurtransferase